MSATRDSSQNAAFVFSSLYHLYQKERAKALPGSPIKGLVLATPPPPTTISPSDQNSFQSWATNEIQVGKKNLACELLELRRARKKLSFLIQEMDELLKREQE